MNKNVFVKVFSHCEDQQDIEKFQAVLKLKIQHLKRSEAEKSFLMQALGEVAEQFSKNISI